MTEMFINIKMQTKKSQPSMVGSSGYSAMKKITNFTGTSYVFNARHINRADLLR